MSCCAAGTESAAELEALKSQGPSAEEMWLSSRALGDGMRQVDLIVDSGPCKLEPSTVVDLTGAVPVIVRKGLGRIEGLEIIHGD